MTPPSSLSPEVVMLIEHLVTSGLIVFMKVVCFILGYLTIRLGHQLLAAGVKGEFKFSGSIGGVKADLASVSPGLLFVLLGVLLIGYAITVTKSSEQIIVHRSQAAAPDVRVPNGPLFPDAEKETVK